MELNELVDLMTVEIYQRLLSAVELGKWPDGVALTPEQKKIVCRLLCFGRQGIIIMRSI